MHWYAALLVYFHWSLLNWRNSVAYSFCWYMNQLSLFYFVLFCFSRPDYRDILLWYLKYGVWFFCRQVLLTCPNVFVVLKIKISWFLIPEHANSKSVPSSPIWRYRYTQPQYSVQYRHNFTKIGSNGRWHIQGWFYVCAQPMRDSVTLWRRLSLAGRKPRISSGKTYLYYCRSLASI